MVETLYGAEVTLGTIAAMREVYFESFIFSVCDLKLVTKRTDAWLPRRLPAVEFESRVDELRRRLGPGYTHWQAHRTNSRRHSHFHGDAG
eukprot:958575-Amphidinium_carterae.1